MPGQEKSSWEVESALKQLSTKEKISLLSGRDWWHTVPIPRLKIPSIRVSDGPNGVRGTKFFDGTPAACFPCGTAIGATFDRELTLQIGHLLAEEAKAKNVNVVLGPTVNVQRSPLGGRGFESFSEDPVLSGLIAASYCQGLSQRNIIPTLKHFVCNDQEHERMAANSLVSKRALREIYLKPFQIAIKEANPATIMTAYNKVNGIHASENENLLQDILRGEWGWDGTLMSDWYGTYSTTESVLAGLDIEMPGPARWRGDILDHAVSANKVTLQAINDRARNILKLVKAAQDAGLEEDGPEEIRDHEEDRLLLRRVAAESVVLLKNEGDILPLNNAKSVAVIGTNATLVAYCGGGSASLAAYRAITPLEAIRMQAEKDVEYAEGVCTHQMLPQMGSLMKTKDGKQGYTLYFYNDPPSVTSRQPFDTRQIVSSSALLADYDHQDLQKIWYADAVGTFKPSQSGTYDFGLCVVGTGRLYVDGKLLVKNDEDQRQGTAFLGLASIEETGAMDLVAGQTYDILMQFGCSETSSLKPEGVVSFGNGAFSFGCCRRMDVEDRIQQAVNLASKVEQVVLVTGLTGEWETEGKDRENMDLPPGVDTMIADVLKANPNTTIVIQSGMPVAMPWIDQAKAVVQAWYGGNESGHGIADVLFGRVNPCAKLPVTFPKRVQDNPAYLNSRTEGGRVLYGEDVFVGYRYYDIKEIEPAFSFGHGLSYTSFEIGDLELHQKEDRITVSCNIQNTGPRGGAEVLQLYVTAPEQIITCPPKQLQAFEKILLEAGETRNVTLEIDAVRVTSFWDEKTDSWFSSAGNYKILLGNTSAGPFKEVDFQVKQTKYWNGL